MMTQQIVVQGMSFFAYHGYYEEERRIGCKYSVDVAITLSQIDACDSDLLEQTINYEQVYDLVKREMSIPSKLIEHVAQRIFNSLRRSFPQILHLDLWLYKYAPPFKGGEVSKTGIHLYD